MENIIDEWLKRDPDPKTREELQHLVDCQYESELQARFSQRLEFGTAGLRGKVGAGPNRMNRLVVQETSTGLGHYLLDNIANAAHRGVIVGYDGRTDSKQFAHDTASVLTALGIKVYLTYKVAPTPVVAFGIKPFNAAAAIVVTASHNPPEYNGYKVYWENGAQIIPPHDQGIAGYIEQAATKPLPIKSLEDAEKDGLLVWLKQDYYQTYFERVLTQPHLDAKNVSAVSVAYTALHGVGAELAEALLTKTGVEDLYSVQEQREPDGTFPTVHFPNPEEDGAMDHVISLAQRAKADLACANDPDADRFAVAVKSNEHDYEMLTGDQVGVLLGNYLLEKHPNSLVGNTIVSSRLLGVLASQHHAAYFQTLTGFKWLTNVAMQKQTAQHPFLFAYEEALGYTIGNQVWDKDGLSALVTFVQMASYLKAQGQTVWDKLEGIYRTHGVYLNQQVSITLNNPKLSIGDKLRTVLPREVAGVKVVIVEDLKASLRYQIGKTAEALTLPASDVLIYTLEDNSRIIVRPSGTEPKLKCYYEVVTEFEPNATYAQIKAEAQLKMNHLIDAHQKVINDLT